MNIMVKTTMEINKSTLEELKQVGTKSQTYDELIRLRFKCNSTDCEQIGSVRIGLNEGTSRSITVFVCPQCVGRIGTL